MTEGVFTQNLTSDLMYKTLAMLDINKNTKILDLGCGDGNIGLRVAELRGLKAIWGSDISNEAIKKATQSAENNKIIGKFRVGPGLQPWKNEIFDIISCDIAAISQPIAELSDWYKNVSCMTGADGLKLVIPVIKEAKQHLTNDGIFIIPRISLANESRLEKTLKKTFKNVECVNEKQWPMPKTLIDQIKQNRLSEKTDNWRIELKFGIHVAYTSIYICR